MPSTTFEGEKKIITPNPHVYIYDTSGPFSDPDIEIDLKKGLPRLREEWILKRGDVEQLPEISSEYGRMRRDDKSLDPLRFEHIALPYRANPGNISPKWHMPNKVSSLRKWNMWLSAKT